MKKISLVFIGLICFIGSGCGSSSSSTTEDVVITNAEYASVTYNTVNVIDTENSGLSCDPEGGNCYSFITRFSEGQWNNNATISLAIIGPSGHRLFMDFVSELVTGRTYEYNSGRELLQQDLLFYATYDSYELECSDDGCNVYNYPQSCYDSSVTCKYYEIVVRENTEAFFDIEFDIWNMYFLGDSLSDSGRFTGRIRIDKKAHMANEELTYQ